MAGNKLPKSETDARELGIYPRAFEETVEEDYEDFEPQEDFDFYKD
jgi:hypothetical protein